ncbi:DUF4097 family beta strand repeat-containing protein [Streptomyces sp. NBC_00102]|uniref:DUF4097 family beta strand repeat-containing protein n=1 Tax=Streptomyces sp. NBC_00102 TaxID=2975652 RepID=UPI00225568E1|nr:DUF4097 family beta strand repeat-containing protein [Streptomyces sp. NBC_00102]MCX5396743.1 DUF4097 domain-containing protein [Streptomyces sp. NBC_00102]
MDHTTGMPNARPSTGRRRTARPRLARRGTALLASAGALLVAVAVSGCGSTDVEGAPVEHKSFALRGKTLTIDSSNTSLELVPADVDKVEVERQTDGWVVFGSGPDPVWKMEDGTLTLKVKCTGVVDNCSGRHRVKVPRGVAVKASGDNGKVTASGFDTRLELSSDNGGLVVRDAGGELKLSSDNGAIDAKGLSGPSVVVGSDNGAIRLGFDTAPDLLDVDTDNGSTHVELPGGDTAYAVDAKASNGHVSVDVPRSDASPHAVKVRSDNGEVSLTTAN